MNRRCKEVDICSQVHVELHPIFYLRSLFAGPEQTKLCKPLQNITERPVRFKFSRTVYLLSVRGPSRRCEFTSAHRFSSLDAKNPSTHFFIYYFFGIKSPPGGMGWSKGSSDLLTIWDSLKWKEKKRKKNDCVRCHERCI